MNKVLFITSILFVFISKVYSQSSIYSSHFYNNYHILNRTEILSGNLRNNVFLDYKGIERKDIIRLLQDSREDNKWINYLYFDALDSPSTLESNSKPIFKSFYKSNPAFIELNDKENYSLIINPVLAFQYGIQNENDNPYRNTRGMELRGNLGDKIGFYSYLATNLAGFTNFQTQLFEDRFSVLGEGFVTSFKDYGYDYFTARAHITAQVAKPIQLVFGNDRINIGDGYRSLLFSSSNKDFLNLQFRTKIWHLQYVNLFTEFIDYSPNGSNRYAKKYGAFHYLTLDATKWLNFGLFEGIIFNDFNNSNRGYELAYLNPIIFYRAVERNYGSTDNSLIGFNASAIISKKFKLYTQIMLDEFVLSDIRAQNGSVRNKYAVQLGAQSINTIGIKNLDSRLELNVVRPFTYTSTSTGQNYEHWRYSLAHPLGANFIEGLATFDYAFNGKWWINVKGFYMIQGLDSGSFVYGGDIRKPYTDASKEFDNTITQGLKSTTLLMDAKISYMLYHNLFLDFNIVNRINEKNNQEFNNSYIGFGIRLNFVNDRYDF
jgi:hypothetical protein